MTSIDQTWSTCALSNEPFFENKLFCHNVFFDANNGTTGCHNQLNVSLVTPNEPLISYFCLMEPAPTFMVEKIIHQSPNT